MFLMFTLKRPDVLPLGDLGFKRGAVKYFGMKPVKSGGTSKGSSGGSGVEKEIEERCLVYRPFRSIVARVFWRYGAPAPAKTSKSAGGGAATAAPAQDATDHDDGSLSTSKPAVKKRKVQVSKKH